MSKNVFYNILSAWTVIAGRVDVVKLLIASGADVKLKDAEGRTAEDRAQEYNQPEVFKLLHTEWMTTVYFGTLYSLYFVVFYKTLTLLILCYN